MNHLLPVLGLIRRETLVALRRKSSVFRLVVLVVCFLLMVAFSWPSSVLLYLGQVGYVSRDILNALAFVGVMFFLIVITESLWFRGSTLQGFVLSTSPIFAYLESFRPSMMGSGNSPTWPFKGFSVLTWLRGTLVYSALSFLFCVSAMELFVRRFRRRR